MRVRVRRHRARLSLRALGLFIQLNRNAYELAIPALSASPSQSSRKGRRKEVKGRRREGKEKGREGKEKGREGREGEGKGRKGEEERERVA